MADPLEAKRVEIVARMKVIKARLECGDDSELLVWILPGVSGTWIAEVPFAQRVQAKTFIQLAREQQPGIGGDRDRGSPELDAKLGIEREANLARRERSRGGP